jgi:hypothetical protein
LTDRLPNALAAQIDLRKLRDYCLSPQHPRGRNKARVFRASLGLEQRDASWLEAAIKAALVDAEAVKESTDDYGTRWRVDLLLQRQGRFALVRTVWQIPEDGAAPRLVTCYVLSRNQGTSGDA